MLSEALDRIAFHAAQARARAILPGELRRATRIALRAAEWRRDVDRHMLRMEDGLIDRGEPDPPGLRQLRDCAIELAERAADLAAAGWGPAVEDAARQAFRAIRRYHRSLMRQCTEAFGHAYEEYEQL